MGKGDLSEKGRVVPWSTGVGARCLRWSSTNVASTAFLLERLRGSEWLT